MSRLRRGTAAEAAYTDRWRGADTNENHHIPRAQGNVPEIHGKIYQLDSDLINGIIGVLNNPLLMTSNKEEGYSK